MAHKPSPKVRTRPRRSGAKYRVDDVQAESDEVDKRLRAQGTQAAKDLVERMKPPKTAAEFKKKQKLVGAKVAVLLNLRRDPEGDEERNDRLRALDGAALADVFPLEERKRRLSELAELGGYGAEPDFPPMPWERELRTAARRDNCASFREHLRRLGIAHDDGTSMLDGTIGMVGMCGAYAGIDGCGGSLGPFFKMQKYNPAKAKGAGYIFTFDIGGKAYARILMPRKCKNFWPMDLADLYGACWWNYKVAGYDQFWISHPDWSAFSDKELKRIEDAVTEDLRFDYGAEEVQFQFHDEYAQSDFCPVNQFLWGTDWSHTSGFEEEDFEEEFLDLKSHFLRVEVYDASERTELNEALNKAQENASPKRAGATPRAKGTKKRR